MPIVAIASIGASMAGMAAGLAIGSGLAVAAHAALAMEPKK